MIIRKVKLVVNLNIAELVMCHVPKLPECTRSYVTEVGN